MQLHPATGSADPRLVAQVLEVLEGLIGLAPGEVARRRLERRPDLLPPALQAAPDIAHAAWAAVVDAVTVQETRLFRNPAQLGFLQEVVLPDLVRAARARGARRLRLLSAGCATGEEAWSLAALAQDALANSDLRLEVVGLDLSRPALATAGSGVVPAGPVDPLRDVPPAFRAGFAVRPQGVEVSGALRQGVRFARANLLDLADAEGFDAVLCRNVCIYLTDAARARVGANLAAALRPGGALLLGPTDKVVGEAGLRPWSSDTVSVFRAMEPRHD